MLKVIEGLEEFCTLSKATKFSACIDLCAAEDVVIGAGETVLVPLGVKIDFKQLESKAKLHLIAQLHEDYMTLKESHFQNVIKKRLLFFMQSHQLNLHIRSSMSAKHGLIIANGTGIIDLDYEDEIKICLYNTGSIQGNTLVDEDGHIVDSLAAEFEYPEDYVFKQAYKIEKGQPIAQISLVEHKSYLFGIESKEERKGGFGSTDKS